MRFPVVVLAGGLATRLYPITEKIPKSLISINNAPFVLHQLNLFKRNGIDKVHYCLGNLGEMVRNAIEMSSFKDSMSITYSFDGEILLGTEGAVKKALPFLPETFFVTYGDSYLDIDYSYIESQFIKFSKENNGLMTVYKNDNKFDTSNVIFENNRIVLYSKKKSSSKMEYIDYGLSILKKSHFDNSPENTPCDLSILLEKLSEKGELLGFELFERFYEIGSLNGIEDLSNYLITKKK